MKKYLFFFYLCLICFLSLGNLTAQVDTLTILHINDTHSTLAPLGPRSSNLQGTQGGIARAATVIGETRASDPNVLVLHAGDVFIGDLFFNKFFGIPEFQLMRQLGFDAMTVGNHEFDLGPSTLNTVLRSSFNPGEGFPLLSANLNLDDPSLADLKNYISPYTEKRLGNIKVGIFGLTTPEANILSMPSPAVVDTNIFPIAVDMISKLKADTCSVIILLSHLGYNLDQLIAANIPGIDVIVGGHDHYLFKQPVEVTNPSGKKTYIVQVGAFYEYMGKMQLAVSTSGVSLLNYKAIHLDSSIPLDPNVNAVVNGLIAEIENTYGPVFSQQIGYVTNTLDEVADNLLSSGIHDTPIGDLVTNAFKWKTGADIAIEPGGFTAQPLYKGPIVAADLFRINGYGFNTDNGLGFRLATFDIKGSDLLYGLSYGLSSIELNDEFLIQSSGLDYVYDGTLSPESRLVGVKVNGAQIDPDKTYKVASNEAVISVLSMLGITFTNLHIYEGLSEFQVLTEYVTTKLQVIHPDVFGRIADIHLPDNAGIANGGGIIISPQGALYNNTNTNGHSEFGFSVKYSGNLKDVKGNTNFAFKNGSLHLNSNNYDWLIVNGNNALFRGTAKVNGSGDFGYMIAAFDGAKPGNKNDKFRIRIWNNEDGEMIYDNVDNQNIALGSIVIMNKNKGYDFADLDNGHGNHRLFQNFPNPFNPSTSIKFIVSEQEFVSLKIYNSIGQEVASLVNQMLPAGEYNYTWNAAHLASGIYFYKFRTGNFVEVKKMILMK